MFDPEDIERMIEECSQKHLAIDEGLRDLFQTNACWHFKPFGDFVIGRSVVVSEVLDEFGHVHLISFGSKGLRPWEVKGMLGYVEANIIGDDV